MNWISVLILFLLPFHAISQEDTPFKNEIGLIITQTTNAGSGTSLRYKRKLFDLGIAKFELNTNHRNTFFCRVGYEPIKLVWGSHELGLGVDVKYERNDFREFGWQSVIHEFSFELPIEWRFNIASKYTVFCGFSLSKLIRTSRLNCNTCHQTISETRVGLGYKF